MKIEIESEVLIANQISANQYCYLYMKTMYSHVPVIFTLDEYEHGDLESKGFIKITDVGSTLREKAYLLFEINNGEKCWLEFKLAYPIKSGERRLHDNQEKCKKKYLEIVRNKPFLHLEILRGVSGEQSARVNASRKREFFPDWKLMSSYLNSKQWDLYKDYQVTIEEERTEGI